MIAAFPHFAFCVALAVGATVGFITAGVLRIAREADAEDEPLSDYQKPVRTKIWGGNINDGGKS